MQGPLGSGTILVTSGTTYWVFGGIAYVPMVIPYVKTFMGKVGAGAQTAEIAVATSPNQPNPANQTLTVVSATGTITSLTAAVAVIQNTSAFTASVFGPYWFGIRIAMATTQPTFSAFNRDYGRGNLLKTAASGVLTVGTAYTGATIAATDSTSETPVLWESQDA